MAFEFVGATRKRARARLAIAGPSGSGKSYTALTLATALVGARTVGDGKRRIAVIDTERDSADLYAANPDLPDVDQMHFAEAGGFGFSKIAPVRFDPRELVQVIDAAAEQEFRALVLDSATHYWSGPGGILEQVDIETRRNSGRSMDGWKAVRPIERAYIEALLGFPGHVIVTLRSKQTYQVEDGDAGKKKVTKLGLQPEQRDGLEYEFTLFGDMDVDHYLRVSKSRCSALADAVIHKPGPELAHQLLTWLETGEEPKYVDWAAELRACQSIADLNRAWAKAERGGVSRILRGEFSVRKAEIAAAEVEAAAQYANGSVDEEVPA
jgi:hypothetical protein